MRVLAMFTKQIVLCIVAFVLGILSQPTLTLEQDEKSPETTEATPDLFEINGPFSSESLPTVDDEQQVPMTDVDYEFQLQLDTLKKFFDNDKLDLEETTNALSKFPVEDFNVAISGNALQIALRMNLIEDAKRWYQYEYKVHPYRREELVAFQDELLRALSNWNFSGGTLSDLAYLIDAYKNEEINLDVYREQFKNLMEYELADDDHYYKD